MTEPSLADPPKTGRSSCVVWGLGCFGAGIIGCVLITIVSVIANPEQFQEAFEGVVPLDLVEGHELTDRQRQQLLDHGLVDPDETIVVFYSAGVFSILEDGNIITETRVISYFEDEDAEDGIELHWAEYDEILEVSIVDQGDTWSDSLISADLADDEFLEFWCPVEHGQDTRFVTEIRSRMRD